MNIADAHCHFFSSSFFETLGHDAKIDGEAATVLPQRLGWDPPGTHEALADRWASELDRHDVALAMLIASVPGDELAVASAVRRHPTRFSGAFMVNAGAADAVPRAERAFVEHQLRTVCLFPAMHHVPVDDPRSVAIFELAAKHGRRVFVHCGILSVGVRRRLGLPSPFDLRLGDPLAVAAVAVRYPGVPVVIPHFGAGRFVESLTAAQAAPNILLDTSSSNSWVRMMGLGLRDVVARAIDCVGPERLLFGTDSSYFPRGWHRAVFEDQRSAVASLGLDAAAEAAIFGGNLMRSLEAR
jgi:predicted TIM-barrel fold metal-dependent hydrolase